MVICRYDDCVAIERGYGVVLDGVQVNCPHCRKSLGLPQLEEIEEARANWLLSCADEQPINSMLMDHEKKILDGIQDRMGFTYRSVAHALAVAAGIHKYDELIK